MSQAEEFAKEYEEGKGDEINPGTGGWYFWFSKQYFIFWPLRPHILRPRKMSLLPSFPEIFKL